jgi:uncharacterized membrane protein
MEHEFDTGVASTAAVGKHPIHPMLVPFPIAFLVGALLTDLAYWGTYDRFWAVASMWLLIAGLVGGVLAATAGLIDFFTIQRARSVTAGWIHFLGNASALIVALINLWPRVAAPEAPVLFTGLILSAVVVGILVVTGWMGGELAYRYKIGVIEEGIAHVEPHRVHGRGHTVTR